METRKGWHTSSLSSLACNIVCMFRRLGKGLIRSRQDGSLCSPADAGVGDPGLIPARSHFLWFYFPIFAWLMDSCSLLSRLMWETQVQFLLQASEFLISFSFPAFFFFFLDLLCKPFLLKEAVQLIVLTCWLWRGRPRFSSCLRQMKFTRFYSHLFFVFCFFFHKLL